ncbi:MAG TPA: F0F1 ATP synthase subunit delta [Vicinamibacterales bacterium]|nr:F0F1 ATP synthase subunit delta [Vicinamibacterales bacterium]
MKTTRQSKREARQLFSICVVNGHLDENRVKQIVQRVVSDGRHGGLTTLSRFLRLVRLDRARHSALVESAVPLSQEIRTRIEDSLRREHGPGLVTTFTENRALLAGLRIQVGSDVYDGSVQGRLNALETRL